MTAETGPEQYQSLRVQWKDLETTLQEMPSQRGLQCRNVEMTLCLVMAGEAAMEHRSA